MDIEFKAKEAINLLLEKGYIITSLEYNKDIFGNILIVVSNAFFSIRFISDRQDYICQIICKGEAYSIGDVFDVLDVKLQSQNQDFFVFVTSCITQFVAHEKEIINCFSDENLAQTTALINKISKERVFRIFGL